VPINKKRKLGPKIVDCGFLGCTHHSIAYRFLVIKLEVFDVHVDTFLESRDVTFFEKNFPMKNLYVMSSLLANVVVIQLLNLLKILIMLNIHLNQSMRRLIVNS
jgi:hypothetical protein